MSKQKKLQTKRELRTTIQGSQLEIREVQGGRTLAGRCVVFNQPANIGGAFLETIAPSSFSQTLREDDQIMLRDHRSELLLGRRSAGTLTLSQDQIGVTFEVSLPDTELGRDTYENVRLGNLRGCSFGFLVRDDEWSQDAAGNLTRLLKNVQCFEVTLTSMPAYDSTSVDIRSVRAKLNRSVDEDDDSEDDDESDVCNPDSPDYDSDADCEDRCDCTCEFCSQDDDCSSCSDDQCDATDCLSCPAQTRAAHPQLLIRRLK